MSRRITLAITFMTLVAAALVGCNAPSTPAVSEPDAAASTVTAPSTTAVAGEAFTVTVQLRDAAGEALRRSGRQVTFTATSGTLATLADTRSLVTETVLTDGEGRASVLFTPSEPGTVTVRAFIGPDASGPEIGTVSVTIVSAPIEIDGVTVTYDGTPVTLTPRFYPPTLVDSASFVYRSGGTVLAGPPTAAGTYELTVTAGTNGEHAATATIVIEPRPLAVTNVVWADKVYDGTPLAHASSATLDASGIVGSDDVGIDAARHAAFAASAAGTHAVTGAFVLAGADAANYRVHAQPTGTARITPAPLQIDDPQVQDKVYDGTIAATVHGTLVGSVDGDDVVVVGAFVDPNAATDVAVELALSGADCCELRPGAHLRARLHHARAADDHPVAAGPRVR